ncbi:putative cytoplasmic protein [Salmonella enterica subsp. enterica serovar Gallinarum/Pullorum str. CDC1983-67]|nr:putative cytoplasmic protein [Salmonella enterica subsp. enterica serovar Gallinarum/Pullorum str. RKS5078]AGU65972.1 putative cytoplasmic protein [Salmonella enterica subsp. enterica serovar Gallinarum/Pullorum str. CDC1983-67]AUC47631.1 NADH-ubiquinone oxidoreductase chain F [Salmonella enterica subsp. enterica serovar Typhimurium]
MKVINSVIVNPLILRAGRNSPPAVNQRCLTHFSSRRAVTERGEQVESPRALFAIAKRSADPV